MSFYKRVLFGSRVFWAFFLSLSLAAGAAQSTTTGPRREVVSEKQHMKNVKHAALVPVPVLGVPVFQPAEHFSLECWGAFSGVLQYELCDVDVFKDKKFVFASIAPGKCFGSDDKDHYGVNTARVFLDLSKESSVCVNPSSEIGTLIKKEPVENQIRVLIIARSQEDEFFTRATMADGFDLAATDWIVIVVNDAPHLKTKFPGLRNFIVVPSIKALVLNDSYVIAVRDGKIVYPWTTVDKKLVKHLGGDEIATKKLAKQVAGALQFFVRPEVVAEPVDA